MKRRMWTALLPLMTFLAACEDEGNAGNDNLLTGGSLVVLIIIVIVIFLVMRRRR
jgi:hypothetical protein